MKSVLFICMANICRSPTLEATLKHLAAVRGVGDQLYVDSCGIGWVRIGQQVDPRSFVEAKKRGIFLDHKSQQFQDCYFEAFDYLFAVDQEIVEQLKIRAPHPQHSEKIYLATAFSRKFSNREIPDPYYMGDDGFTRVMDIVVDSCEGILQKLF